MTKYILLYNYFGGEYDRDNLRVLKLLIPDLAIKPFQIVDGEIESGKSIWIPEDKYLIAWTIWNYEDLMDHMRTGNPEYTTVESGIEWFEIRRNNDLYVWIDGVPEVNPVDIKRLYKQYVDAMQLLEEMRDKMTFDEFGTYIDILENNGIAI